MITSDWFLTNIIQRVSKVGQTPDSEATKYNTKTKQTKTIALHKVFMDKEEGH